MSRQPGRNKRLVRMFLCVGWDQVFTVWQAQNNENWYQQDRGDQQFNQQLTDQIDGNGAAGDNGGQRHQLGAFGHGAVGLPVVQNGAEVAVAFQPAMKAR